MLKSINYAMVYIIQSLCYIYSIYVYFWHCLFAMALPTFSLLTSELMYIIQSLCYIYTVGTGIMIHYVYSHFSLVSQTFRGLFGARRIGVSARDRSLFMRVSGPVCTYCTLQSLTLLYIVSDYRSLICHIYAIEIHGRLCHLIL